MFFLFFNNADVKFTEKKLTQRAYNTNEALPTIKQVQFIDRKEFIVAGLDLGKEAFIVHIVYLRAKMSIYPA